MKRRYLIEYEINLLSSRPSSSFGGSTIEHIRKIEELTDSEFNEYIKKYKDRKINITQLDKE